jgi:deoxyribonuclease V
MAHGWPVTPAELVETQHRLGDAAPPRWDAVATAGRVGGCFVCFGRGGGGPGAAGDPGWAAAAVMDRTVVVAGQAGAGYAAGLLALREGPLLEAAVGALPVLPDVLLVNATGRDHPRRAGLALHLGAVLDLPTVGVTHRPLCAGGDWPGEMQGEAAPLLLDGERVGAWVRTRGHARPVAVHAAWRTDPDVAVAVIRSLAGSHRTPGPLRDARRAARRARAGIRD